MFQKGDALSVGALKLRFLQDAQQLGDAALGRIAYGGIAAGADGRRYYVKYAGAFEEGGGREYLRRVMQRWKMMDVQGGRPATFASPFLAGTAASGESSCGKTAINAVVLDYAEGISLPERIRQIRNMERDKKGASDAYILRLDLIRQLLLGMRDYMEDEKGRLYIHRDLKPENIRVQVRADGRRSVQQLRILDFDFMLGPEEMPGGGGTAGYTHPDLYFGKGLSHTDPQKRLSWDLYSAGMLIYYILEGTEHFSQEEFNSKEEDEALFTLKPARFEKFRPELADMIRDMICRDQTRFQSMDSVIAAFQDYLHRTLGGYFAPRLHLPQYLESIPAQEESAKRRSLFCEMRELDAEGATEGISCFRSFLLYDAGLLRLTWGKGGNLSGAGSPETALEVGAVSYLPDDTARPLVFISYSDAARGVEEDGKLRKIVYEDRDSDGHTRRTLELLIIE